MQNFVRNSFNVRDQKTLSQLWDAFSGATKKVCELQKEGSQLRDLFQGDDPHLSCDRLPGLIFYMLLSLPFGFWILAPIAKFEMSTELLL